MKRKPLAEIAVENRERYGQWQVEARVEGSTRKVVARCLDCNQTYEVDLYHLRRKDRACLRCRSCNNIVISVSNRLGVGEHLVNMQCRDYRKNAEARGIEWALSDEQVKRLVLSDCYYCGTVPNRRVESSWDVIFVNGIDRVDNNNGYLESNCVSCCKDCNYAKRTMSAQEYIILCKKVAAKCA